jgi:hypothetical protein
MLFNICGFQGPGIFFNWEVMGDPHLSSSDVNWWAWARSWISQGVKVFSFGTFFSNLSCHDGDFFHLSYFIACSCFPPILVTWVRTTEAKMDEELGKGREVPLLVFSASQVTHRVPGLNIKSTGNLNGMWLKDGAASLLDCCPPNSKSLNLSKPSTNS